MKPWTRSCLALLAAVAWVPAWAGCKRKEQAADEKNEEPGKSERKDPKTVPEPFGRKEVMNGIRAHFVNFRKAPPVKGQVRIYGNSADSTMQIDLTGPERNLSRATLYVNLKKTASEGTAARNQEVIKTFLANCFPGWPDVYVWYRKAMKTPSAPGEPKGITIKNGKLVRINLVDAIPQVVITVINKSPTPAAK